MIIQVAAQNQSVTRRISIMQHLVSSVMRYNLTPYMKFYADLLYCLADRRHFWNVTKLTAQIRMEMMSDTAKRMIKSSELRDSAKLVVKKKSKKR